jgi:hypothetical protein
MRIITILLPVILGMLWGCRQPRADSRQLKYVGADSFAFPALAVDDPHIRVISGIKYVFVFDRDSKRLYYQDITHKKSGQITGGIFFVSHPSEQLETYYIHSFDSIFWVTSHHVLLTDSTGSIHYIRGINDSSTHPVDTVDRYHYGRFAEEYPLYYEPASHMLYMYRYRVDIGTWLKEWNQSPIEVGLDLSTSRFSTLPYTMPEIYHNHFFGDASTVYKAVLDSVNVIGFAACTDIIVYNRYTRQIQQKKMETHLFQEEIQPFDPKADPLDIQFKMDYMLRYSMLCNFYYEPSSRLYYRVALDGVKPKNQDGTYNTYKDKPIVVSIYDASFKLLHERVIGKGFYGFQCYTTPTGLNIFKKEKQLSNEIILYLDVYNYQ